MPYRSKSGSKTAIGFRKTQVAKHWPTHTYSQKWACQDGGKKNPNFFP
jgi:hypothetical protein